MKVTRKMKIQALMDFYGLSRTEAITELKDMGEY